MRSGQAIVLRGDALKLPLPDESVDLIVTSPPYFALRSYLDDGDHYEGQIGSEPTPQEFLEALWSATREMVRVLKPSGSIFVNLGDKYAGSGGQNNGWGDHASERRRKSRVTTYNKESGGVRRKSLMALPWRYAIGCIDDLGLILRAEMIWRKPNGIPESVTDRVRRSHEQWFHFTKEEMYFAAIDEIREEPLDPVRSEIRNSNAGKAMREGRPTSGTKMRPHTFNSEQSVHPLGKLPGSVWTVATESLVIPTWAKERYALDEHFAAFPTEWPRRLILGWSPGAICDSCGNGRHPVVSREAEYYRGQGKTGTRRDATEPDGNERGMHGSQQYRERVSIIGYACACTPFTDHPGSGEKSPTVREDGRQGQRPVDIAATHRRVGPRREYHIDGWTPPASSPAVVLDPFGGTGTVALVAKTLGRVGISVDLSHDYSRLARWRVHQSGHGRKAESRTWSERQGMLL